MAHYCCGRRYVRGTLECLFKWFTFLFRFPVCSGHHPFGKNWCHSRRNVVTAAAPDTELDEPAHQLIPGVHDEVTLKHIVPKLHWTAFRDLYSVSSHWAHAIESGEVYKERVRAEVTETLVVYFNCPGHNFHSLGIYSNRNSCVYKLPPIPDVPTGIPYQCQCISLESKLYVIGGAETRFIRNAHGYSQVHVLDTLGRRRWRPCANMHEPRCVFGAGVTDGKIYVFGGVSDGKLVCGSEVFDPKVNAWFPITSKPSLSFAHRVSALDSEILVHGGYFLDVPTFDRVEGFIGGNPDSVHVRREIQRLWMSRWNRPSCLEVYNPKQNQWRLIQGPHRNSTFCVANGAFYGLYEKGLYRYEALTNTWLLTQNISLSGVLPAAASGAHIQFLDTVAVDHGELLASAFWFYEGGDGGAIFFLRSKYFGSSRDIEWEVIERRCCTVSRISNTRPPFRFGCAPFLYSIVI